MGDGSGRWQSNLGEKLEQANRIGTGTGIEIEFEFEDRDSGPKKRGATKKKERKKGEGRRRGGGGGKEREGKKVKKKSRDHIKGIVKGRAHPAEQSELITKNPFLIIFPLVKN
ncbi:hypothetical protein CI102_775 [Trichoderma harzianum]|nr:hypothetical protein CI102_775 [Trichoderma harzianum]